jgi:hypothetical protein
LFIAYVINDFHRSVKSDSGESSKLIEKFNTLLGAESVKTAVPKASLSLLREELVGDIKKR